MRIGLDIDNVVSDFDKKMLEEFLKEDKKKRNKGIINPEGKWIKYFFDWSDDEIKKFLITNQESFAKDMELRKDAKYYMDKMLEDGHQLYLISNRVFPDYKNPYETTINWLKEKDINYTKLVLSKSENKSSECKRYNVDVMFDDAIKNCRYLKENNIKCFLMATEYNKKNSEGLNVVNDWKELYEEVCKLSKAKKHVILDTDINNEADDQFALSYLLKSQDIFTLEAVTIAPYKHKVDKTISEGIEKSYKVCEDIFKLCNIDSENYIYKGSADYFKNGYIETEAIRKMKDVIDKNNLTYIIAIGAITNIAVLLKLYPDVKNKIKIVWLGGHYKNIEKREFNARQDLEAIRYVINNSNNLTILPCAGVVDKLEISIDELNKKIKDSDLKKYLCDRFYNDGYHDITERRVIWDISAVAYLINSNWFKVSKEYVSDIKDDTTYVLDKEKTNVTLLENLDREEIYKDLFRKLGDN